MFVSLESLGLGQKFFILRGIRNATSFHSNPKATKNNLDLCPIDWSHILGQKIQAMEVHIKSPVEKVVIDAKIVEWGGVQVNEQVSAMATEMTLKY